MKFDLEEAMEVLERTPGVLNALLKDISNEWAMKNEGPDTFSPYDVVGHLIHGEKTDWMVRIKIILSDNADKTFTPFDRFAHYGESKGKSLNKLLSQFATLRSKNLKLLRSKISKKTNLKQKGIHPALGTVTLEQLLATWVVHDLSHIAQITRVMSKQYKNEVGPWIGFLPVLTR